MERIPQIGLVKLFEFQYIFYIFDFKLFELLLTDFGSVVINQPEFKNISKREKKLGMGLSLWPGTASVKFFRDIKRMVRRNAKYNYLLEILKILCVEFTDVGFGRVFWIFKCIQDWFRFQISVDVSKNFEILIKVIFWT